MSVLQHILSGSILIAAFALLRLVSGNRLPRRLFPCLWLIATMRLLIPIRIESRLSIYALIAAQAPLHTPNVLATTAIPTVQAYQGTAPTVHVAAGGSGASVLWIVWLAVAVLLGMYFLSCSLRYLYQFRSAVPADANVLVTLTPDVRILRPVHIRITEDPLAPLTYGIFRPVVLLPAGTPAGEKLRHMLTHELMHIRRFDNLLKLLLIATLCLYWWNPLVWLMVALANRDIELACDEISLQVLGSDQRRTYAMLLLEQEAAKLRPDPMCSNFGKSATEERILVIMKKRKTPTLLLLLVIVLAAGIVTVFATQPPTEPNTGTSKSSQSITLPPVAQADAPSVSPSHIETTPVEDVIPQTEVTPETTTIWTLPLDAETLTVSQAFGKRVHPVLGIEASHYGADLAAAYGDSIFAVRAGTVTEAGFEAVSGNYLVIDHGDGYASRYQHCSELFVAVGEAVEAGAQIASVGDSGWATGAHLHLGISYLGEFIDPFSVLP